MLDVNTLFEFSRANCVAICAFLVPANLLFVGQTMVFTGLRRPQVQVRQSTVLGCILALVMILHVSTWLMIGVVMAPTYILLWLASTCISINLWALAHPSSMASLFDTLLTLPLWSSIPFYKGSDRFFR